MTTDVTFGRWVKLRRRGLGLTQKELGRRVGYAMDTIRNVESDELRPSRQLAEKLADELGIPDTERAAFVQFARDEANTEALTLTPHPAPLPPRPTPRHPTSLPTLLTPLLGRDADVAAISEVIRERQRRLVTLTGPAGVGKTRVALQTAETLLPDFDGHVVFVGLAAVSDASLVVSAIGQTVGAREQSSRSRLDSLKDELGDRRLLLVLDNFEQVVPAAQDVVELLAACPGLVALVTSRAALRVRGEQEFPIRPLPVPHPTQAPSFEHLAASPAVRLFVDRAHDVKPDFALTSENAAVVAAICHRLDGLPLAIELAAARIRILPPPTLLARLTRRLKLLTGGPQDMPTRHQALEAALDWSYRLLAEEERRLLRSLAVFVGGCTEEAVEAVTQASGGWTGEALDGLEALMRESLLEQQGGADGEPRFVMLETIREYASDKLAASGEAEVLRGHHLDYYLTLAERAEPELRGERQLAWLNRLEAEHDNLRAALRYGLERGEGERALRLAGALGRFWAARTYWSEGRQWLTEALANSDDRPAPFRAKALHEAGVLARYQGDYSAAEAYFAASLALRRELGDRAGMAASLNNLGYLDYFHRRYASARAYHGESLALYRELGDDLGMATTLNSLGNLAWAEGDVDAAQSLYQDCLASWREAVGENHIAIAQTLNNLGNVAWAKHAYDEAGRHYEASRRLYRKLGDRAGQAWALNNLGSVAWVQGDDARAQALYGESLALFGALGDKFGLATCLCGCVSVAASLGETERAAVLAGAVEALFEALGSGLAQADQPTYERVLADVRASLGDRAFADAWARGRDLELEEVLAYALGNDRSR